MEQNFEGHFRIERMKSRIPWDMKGPHSHNYHEIYYLMSGRRRYFIGRSIFNVEQGDLVIIPKSTLHRTNRQSEGRYERYVIYFSDDFFAPLAKHLGKAETERLFAASCIHIPKQYQKEVQRLFETMESESGRKDDCVSLSNLCALGNLISLVLRHGVGAHSSMTDVSGKIREVAQYLCENFNREISLCDAAKMAYMEETYFSKRFKQEMGFGFSEYISQIRMQQAAELLRNSDLSIGKIAELCGYGSSNYFGDVFRKQNRMSPSAYRKEFQKRKEES